MDYAIYVILIVWLICLAVGKGPGQGLSFMTTDEQKQELKEKGTLLVNRRFGGRFDQAFSYYDADKDDKINRKELMEFLTDAHIGDGWGPFNIVRNRWADGILAEVDKDLDDCLSKEELFSVIATPQEDFSDMDLKTLIEKMNKVKDLVLAGGISNYFKAVQIVLEILLAFGEVVISPQVQADGTDVLVTSHSMARTSMANSLQASDKAEIVEAIEQRLQSASTVDSSLIDVLVPMLWMLVRKLLNF